MPTITNKEIENMIGLFETRKLPKEKWTHQSHLIAAVWYLMKYPQNKVFNILSENIIEYNKSVGTPNSNTSGYHETITWFWLNEVQKFLDKKKYKSIANACKNIINSNLVNRQYPLTFYSEQLLFSSEARKKLLMPDLAVPFTINSRFLVRGDIIESKKEE